MKFYYKTNYICIIFLTPFLLFSFSNNVFAESPSFLEQEIVDNKSDWIEMSTNKILTKEREKYTDIMSVDYFSDGKTLNATLWLLFPFKESPRMKEVNYGMYIDTDFDSKTGFGGIDYKVELQWRNNSWNKVIETWSKFGNERTIANYSDITGFYEKEKHYITMSADLQKILYPQKYKVLFYAEFRRDNGILISDITRWVAIPPLELDIFTIPKSMELYQGVSDNIHVQINSTEGYTPKIDLILDKPQEILIKITPTKDSMLGPQSFYITVKSNFPPDELLNISEKRTVSGENIIQTSEVLLNIKPEPDFLDKIQMSWGKIGDFTQFVYGIIAGLSPFIYQQIRKFTNKNPNHGDS